MSDDIERRLRRVSPRGAPPALRSRVLAAVAAELPAAAGPPAASPRHLTRRPGFPRLHPMLATAAALLAAYMLNLWVNDRLDRRLAAVIGPSPVRRQAAEIAADVASVTDPATGRWAYESLTAGQDRLDARRYALRLRRMIPRFTANLELEGTADETPAQEAQVGRDRRGSLGRRRDDRQCRVRLAHRFTC